MSSTIRQLIQERFGVSWSNSQEMILSNCCNSRVFLPNSNREIADQLEAVRKEVLTTVRS